MKTVDELRATPAHVVCEHGASQRACDACECLALEAENGELKVELASAKRKTRYSDRVARVRYGELNGMRAKLEKANNQINYQCERKLDAVQVASAMRTTMDAAKAKLNTLEAAVRVLRNGEGTGWCGENGLVAELYALVPDGSVSGSC